MLGAARRAIEDLYTDEVVQILDAQMQFGAGLADLRLHGCDVRLQKLDRVAAGVVEYEEAFDFDSPKPLDGALDIYRLDSSF